ncbi:alanine racemase [Candidatus Uhrbacteria bacterium CG_4_9_14_3_um_filter_50_9]|uniref:Alanine racemase n=1 Tax=Candidatus Uhrbacteria bacterium CG_4_9_14_3_um_filter_50_9 TaxID=1975035 RepID=A0A2M7XDT3_9BACT|nr:MAG: alanine racemase [Candidatus Uhrbacteria bacterium CG_4_9_14_3_um_filter_50_9]
MHRHRTWVEVSERALTHNIETLRLLLEKNARFCAVLKSNAYGHGLKEVAQIAGRAGVDAFAVDSIDEALSLRALFPSSLIIVLGYTLFERYEDAIKSNIHLTLYDKEGIEQAESVAKQLAKQAQIHLKIETGTSRQGVLKDDLLDLLKDLQRMPHVRLAGVSTHFANIEDSSNPEYATLQFSRFQEAVDAVRELGFDPELVHCACSAAIILYPDTHATLVRAGISLYGLWSSELVQQTVRNQHLKCDLRPALTWKTRVAQVKSISMGTPVGYGLTEVMKRRGRIAVIPVGYFDGFDRGLSSVGEVLIRGCRCKVIGRICMNMCMVDVSSVPDIQKEDEVILLGTEGRHVISADDMAKKIGTINYEIVTRINPIIPRLVI